MKIVYLSGYPFGKERFGVSEHVFQLSAALARSKRSLTCHILSMHNETRSLRLSSGLWSHTVKRKAHYYLWPLAASMEIASFVRSLDPDIIHLHGTSLPYSLAAVLLAKDYPIITTIHGDLVKEARLKKVFPRLWSLTFSRLLQKMTLQSRGSVIVCSQDMRNRIKLSDKKRVFILPNGIDLDIYKPLEPRGKKPFPYILYLGALNKVKGVDILIRALSLVYQKIGPIPVNIAGIGPEMQGLVRLVKKAGLSSSVTFLGFVSGQEKLDLIQRAGMVVVPSRYESFGIVLLEAMACGVPIVAARAGAIPEIIVDRRTGLLFDVENAAQLAQQICELYENSNLRASCIRQGKEVAKRFSWAEVAEQTSLVYQKCISEFRADKMARS